MSTSGIGPAPYPVASDDPLRAEHAAVAAWIEDAFGSLGADASYRDVALKSRPSGRALLDAEPEGAARCVLAAMAQARHYEAECDRLTARCETYSQRSDVEEGPPWKAGWRRRHLAADVAFALLKRALPWRNDDLLRLLGWFEDDAHLSPTLLPVGGVARAVERFASRHEPTPVLEAAMRDLARRLRVSPYKEVRHWGDRIEQAFAAPMAPRTAAAETDSEAPAALAPPQPAPAGNPAVMDRLKRHLGVAEPGRDVASTPIGPDFFPCPVDSPLRAEHGTLARALAEVTASGHYQVPPLESLEALRDIRTLDGPARARLLLAAAERHVSSLSRVSDAESGSWQARLAAPGLLMRLSILPHEWRREELFDFALYVAVGPPHLVSDLTGGVLNSLRAFEGELGGSAPLSRGERYVLHLFRASLVSYPPLGASSENVSFLTRLIGDGARFYLAPGEFWSDRCNADVAAESGSPREAWIALLRHASRATSARPTEKWSSAAARLVEAIGAKRVRAALILWLAQVPRGRSLPGPVSNPGDVILGGNAVCLRGLLWLVPKWPDDGELTRLTGAVALSAYKKVPGVGPRAAKVGNAAVHALSRVASEAAIGQLALLQSRVKIGSAKKEIGKALDAAARALNVPRDEIEELAVPTYGMEEVGLSRRSFSNGRFVAELRVEGRDVTLAWSRADGRPHKSAPSQVKTEHGDELGELRTAAKDIAGMLPAQAARIDSMFLTRKRWPVEIWRERYLDHALVGTIARRLIWTCRSGGAERAFIWHRGRLVDADDRTLSCSGGAEVEPWHPLGKPADEVAAWREWLERHEVRQPFKQAHREVYVLTDAERMTGTYSNRFAAHVLRQHQFHVLCAARGWKNKLRLLVDDVYPPATRDLPGWGLRAEFWIEGIGSDFGDDTNESGAFLYLSTDQVRFHRLGAARHAAHAGGGGYASAAAGPGDDGMNAPVPLADVDPLVFTEVMRDVDLFVGVASVGNDPTWQDGGPDGRHRDYWNDYSFGELGATATTRRDVLRRLVPRLKIAARCSIEERFLVVRGDLRTYKIHLGSGNILMKPNDQYLCIVPARGAAAGVAPDRTFLPFEGDSTLSIILSKAFLLADDARITDSTITRQILT